MQYLCEKRCVFLFWRLKTDIVSGDRGQCVDKKRKRGLKERPTEKRVKEKNGVEEEERDTNARRVILP